MHFNTSNVNVYPERVPRQRIYRLISIHLMLMFIFILFHAPITAYHFNTSNVNVYPIEYAIFSDLHFISIHLMLMFISFFFFLYPWTSSISIHLMLMFIWTSTYVPKAWWYFNTSNVNVYQ